MDLLKRLQEVEELSEGVASARDKYLNTDKINQSSFDRLVEIDPTPQKKYVDWMAKTFVDLKMHHLDIGKFEIIKDFYTLAEKGIIKNKDIYSYKNIEAVYDEVKKHEDVKTKGEIEKTVKKEGTKVILDNDKVTIVQPVSREASCFYGKGTKWCTAGDVYNYFNSYFWEKGVNLYYVLPKVEGMEKIAIAVYPSGKKEYYKADDSRLTPASANSILKKLGVKI